MDIKKLFEEMASVDKDLVVVHNEKDCSNEKDLEAAHFLKYKGKRYGRDIELYGFMSRVSSKETVAATVLEEVVMPLKSESKKAYDVAIKFLTVNHPFKGEVADKWVEMLQTER